MSVLLCCFRILRKMTHTCYQANSGCNSHPQISTRTKRKLRKVGIERMNKPESLLVPPPHTPTASSSCLRLFPILQQYQQVYREGIGHKQFLSTSSSQWKISKGPINSSVIPQFDIRDSCYERVDHSIVRPYKQPIRTSLFLLTKYSKQPQINHYFFFKH